MKGFETVLKNLVRRLRSAQKDKELDRFRVVIMNDFSLDRLVYLDNFDWFIDRARTVLCQKGGLLPKSRQSLQQGGCAANTATALARLGVRPHFITRTSDLGLVLLDFFLGRSGVDISHAKSGGTLALMTCFEVGAEKHNIMINDLDSFGAFGFDDLDGKDLALIESAHLVGVFDWCLNGKGTDLAGRLLGHLGQSDIVTYLDTSDPCPRRDEIPELFVRVFSKRNLGYLNLNENELKQYAGAQGAPDTLAGLVECAKKLKREIPPVLCIHTSSFAINVDDSVAVAPTFALNPLRTTGAGDSWNGGNILGILLRLPPEERLLLANAVAGYYIVSPEGERSTVGELIDFMEAKKDGLADIGDVPQDLS